MGRLSEEPRFWLTVEISENIFDKFSQHIQFDQPFPPFSTRPPGKLEGILNSVRQTFGNHQLNPTILDAAAAYFNQIIRGHPFQNGNKRIAILLTHVFLLVHNVDFTLSYKDMYYFALNLAIVSGKLDSQRTKEICKKIIEKFTKEI